MKVAVIGGGPAGMMAAITSAKNGHEVYLLEKNSSLGKKLLITGKGRCNITSSLEMSEFIKNIPGNGKFLYSAFQNFTNQDIVDLLGSNGVRVKVERGNRVFPVSDKSTDVLKAFEFELRKNKVNILFNCNVEKIIVNNKKDIENGEHKNKVSGVLYRINGKEKTLDADKIILATGGATYKLTGSTGDGYKFAKDLGHNISKVRPSLVPLVASSDSLKYCSMMQGLSLRNVNIKLIDTLSNKKIYEDFGEMIFTHFGVSGPTILSSSAHLLRYKNVDELLKDGNIELIIDLKPALSIEQLDERIIRDFKKNINKEFKNSLNELLPQKAIDAVIEISGIEKEKKVNEITKKERENLVNTLKNFKIKVSGFRPIDEGIITSGGIDTKQINPKTMESKIISGLFFAGEVIDVDAYTGGFNLQIAYSTGYTAGSDL